MTLRSDKIVEGFRTNPNLLPALNRAIELLHSVGLFEFLREQGRVSVRGLSTDEAALAGAESVGYHRAVEDLMFFREKFLDQETFQGLPAVDYDSLISSVNLGDITKDEADALRDGRKPDYSKLVSPVNTPGQPNGSGNQGSN